MLRTTTVLCAFLTLAGGCDLLKPTVSKEKLEAALAEWLVNEKIHHAQDITCPANVPMEMGGTFECSCKIHDTLVPVRVEVTDPKTGTVEWKPKFLTVLGEIAAAEIQKMPTFADHKVAVTCADEVLVSIPDSEWMCSVVDSDEHGEKIEVTVKFTNGEGAFVLNAKGK